MKKDRSQSQRGLSVIDLIPKNRIGTGPKTKKSYIKNDIALFNMYN